MQTEYQRRKTSIIVQMVILRAKICKIESEPLEDLLLFIADLQTYGLSTLRAERRKLQFALIRQRLDGV